ncbi:MAG: archaeosine synthase subunit alpha, partial [Halobacteriota archaeon]|nr:archaeosine synthase subunit alpha [Halobacteriota archaeon]
MTAYFEITGRDGPARIGKLMLDRVIGTPCILNARSLGKEGPIISMGPIWDYKSKEEILDFVLGTKGSKKLVILPYSPSGGIEEYIQSEIEDEIPTGIVVHMASLREDIVGKFDLCVLPTTGELKKNPRVFVDSIVKVRECIPPDVALHAPAIASPENLAILIYAGVDLVDDVATEIHGYQDLYMTNEGAIPISLLSEELPCLCEVCCEITLDELVKMPKKERSLLLSRHNKLKLTEELKKVKELIRRGLIREYVEKQCRSSPFLTASLRLLDVEPDYLEKRAPVARKNRLYANSMESLSRVEVKRFAERIRTRYRSKGGVLLILPCSARKPYSSSPSHYKFISALGGYRKRVHELIITSPLGVVPRELELVYPAAHYDIPVTGYWDREERSWVAGCLRSYLEKNSYDMIIAHLDGASRMICEEVTGELKMDIEYTSTGAVAGNSSLENLRSTVKKAFEKNEGRSELREDMLIATADYQFGAGAGDKLFAGDIRIK